MIRTRLIAQSHDDFQINSLDPNACLNDFTVRFEADVNDDGIKDEIIVREESFFRLPSSWGDKDKPRTFRRFSHLTATIDYGGDTGFWQPSTERFYAEFVDDYEMSLNEYYDLGNCPENTFAGAYLVENGAHTYLELATRNGYNLKNLRGTPGVVLGDQEAIEEEEQRKQEQRDADLVRLLS
ncbi:MAG: hypothetical protein H7A33_00295 [Deltaproteobacteria bacterium]|nr:hypothetical protein [Deltaproteobacteria bacterium]